MTVPNYSKMEQAIRLAWSGEAVEAREVVGVENVEIVAKLELLAAAPFAYKNATADSVRSAWVRAGGVTPSVPRGSISDPAPRTYVPSI